MNVTRFRAICAALPGTTVDVKWQTREVYSIGGKMFAMLSLDTGGIAFKVDAERFLELTDFPRVRPAPYLARHHWIALDAPDALPEHMLAELLRKSWQLVRARLPASKRRMLPEAANE